MSNKERLEYLIKKDGTPFGNSFFCNVYSSVFFTFDDGRNWDLKWLDIDEDGDIYAVFHESDEKFYYEDFSEREISMLLTCLANSK